MNKILNFILDLIFPKQCLGCGKDDLWLCKKCSHKIKYLKSQVCPICRTNNSGEVCSQCQTHTNLDGLLVATNFNTPLIQKLIHNFKYKYITDLKIPLTNLLVTTIDNYYKRFIIPNSENYIIIPVPLHKKRLRERGFNQSNLLAINLANKIKCKYYKNALYRNRYTETQARLTRKERIINIKSAFNVNKSLDFINKNVIIIDDVATTLSTMEECAKVLKKSGANKVWGLVIARGDL